jgi:hypothetical protein
MKNVNRWLVLLIMLALYVLYYVEMLVYITYPTTAFLIR